MNSKRFKSSISGKRLIIPSIIGAFLIIVIVILLIRLPGNDKTDNNINMQSTDTIVTDNDFAVDDHPDKAQDDIDGNDKAADQTNNDMNEVYDIVDQLNDEADQLSDPADINDDKSASSGSNSEDESTADITAPPVAAAPVADKNDPQAEQSDGVKVDISKISSDDNKAEVIKYGIDVAKWQGVIDWKQLKSSGVEFAMIRVGYRTLIDGSIYEDPYAEYNLQQAAANEIKIGVYFFSTAISKKEAIEEAKWVTELIAAYPITYPVVYNCEGFTNPDNRQYGLSIDNRTELAIAY